MGDSFKWNEGNLSATISELKQKRQELENQQQQLLTLEAKMGNIWRGNEYQKAKMRIDETAKTLVNAISDVNRQITYLEQKNASFVNIRSGL